jgi:hypothetical protein
MLANLEKKKIREKESIEKQRGKINYLSHFSSSPTLNFS